MKTAQQTKGHSGGEVTTPYHFITVHQHQQAADRRSQVRNRHRADSHRLGEAHGDTKQNFFVT